MKKQRYAQKQVHRIYLIILSIIIGCIWNGFSAKRGFCHWHGRPEGVVWSWFYLEELALTRKSSSQHGTRRVLPMTVVFLWFLFPNYYLLERLSCLFHNLTTTTSNEKRYLETDCADHHNYSDCPAHYPHHHELHSLAPRITRIIRIHVPCSLSYWKKPEKHQCRCLNLPLLASDYVIFQVVPFKSELLRPVWKFTSAGTMFPALRHRLRQKQRSAQKHCPIVVIEILQFAPFSMERSGMVFLLR